MCEESTYSGAFTTISFGTTNMHYLYTSSIAIPLCYHRRYFDMYHRDPYFFKFHHPLWRLAMQNDFSYVDYQYHLNSTTIRLQ